MVAEPKFNRVPIAQQNPRNRYEGRWGFYYSAIADWMIANPGGKAEDCARHVGKHVTTVRSIMRTDLFRTFFAERREDWRREHDRALIQKTTLVAEKALDVMLEKLDKQADKIPLALATEVASTALDRLGYAPKTSPAVQVNVDNSDNRKVVMVPITAEALEEARDAIRTAETQRQVESRQTLELEAESPSSDDARSGGHDTTS